MPYYDSTGTVADAITFFGRKLLSACCSALRILLVRRWLRPYNGWMSLPYETRGVLPRFIFHVLAMAGLEAAPGPFASSCHPCPPLLWGVDFL